MNYKLIIFFAFVMTGCQQSSKRANLDPGTSRQIQEAVINWIECFECTNGELDTLLSLGTAVEEPLINTLEKGPSPAKLSRFKKYLEDSYQSMTDYSVKYPQDSLELTFSEYSEIYTSNYYATYSMRSAIALGEIGSQKGADAIRKILQSDNLRPDTRAVLEEVISKF